MSYVRSLYHIVFSTYSRQPTLTSGKRENLYRIMAALIKRKQSKALIIGGIENHVHILLSLHPQVSLSDMMRELKSGSSVWAKESGLFPEFKGWEKEYAAFSVSNNHVPALYDYIVNQAAHHGTISPEGEMARLKEKAGFGNQ